MAAISTKPKWSPLRDLPCNLLHYGEQLKPRFLSAESSLHQAQKTALQRLVDWFGDPVKKALTAVVVMPTGSGKTGVICCLPYTIGGAIAEGKISQYDIDVSKPVLIIAPGIDILNQLEDNLMLNLFFFERGLLKREEKQHNYFVFTVQKTSDVSKLESNKSDIILSNSQKWRKKDDIPNYEDLPSNLFSMVIVDEAHHLPAKQWEEIVRKFRGHAKIVFFTATPYCADEREITTDGAISKENFAYELTREEAIRVRLIRDMEAHFIPFSSPELPPEAKRPRRELDKAYKFEERMKYAKKVLEEVKRRTDEKNRTCPLPGPNKHTSIVITKNILEADKVRKICIHELDFDPAGVVVVHTEKIKADKRKRNEVVSKIKDGTYEMVIIVKMLLEGFDYPPFSVAGIVTRIQSPLKFAQFLGRVQRLVRHKGELETESIKGDVISHDYFDQRKLFYDYINPRIREEEYRDINEDRAEQDVGAGESPSPSHSPNPSPSPSPSPSSSSSSKASSNSSTSTSTASTPSPPSSPELSQHPPGPTTSTSTQTSAATHKHKYNLVLYNVAESTGTSRHQRVRDDHESATYTLSKILHTFSRDSIRDCTRMGKYSPGKTRPLLVKLVRAYDASYILHSLKDLTPEDLDGVAVKRHMSPMKRQAEFILLKERWELVQSGLDKERLKIKGNRLLKDSVSIGEVVGGVYKPISS